MTLSRPSPRVVLQATFIVTTVLALLLYIALNARQVPGERIENLLERVKLTVDAYARLAQLMGLAFGAVAFVVTYQRERKIVLGPHLWFLLMLGLICFFVGLLLSLIGMESLLQM